MAARAIAFEQIYAINSGGEAHKDSDGIVYSKGDDDNRSKIWTKEINYKNIPMSDRNIYKKYVYSKDNTVINYSIPVKNEGYYLLIAKFSYGSERRDETQSMTVNNEIVLLSKDNLFNLCGGEAVCDIYFYFCVSNQTLYHKGCSTLIQNDQIQISIHHNFGHANIAGLVMLKGGLGEHKKIKSSATEELLDFNADKMSPVCIANMRDNSEKRQLQIANDSQKKIAEHTKQILMSIDSSLNQQVSEIQSKTENLFERNHESTYTLMQQIYNESSQQIDVKFEKFQSELTAKTNQVNKNIEAQQIYLQQLIDNQQRSEKKILGLQDEMKTSIIEAVQANVQQLLENQQKSGKQMLDFQTEMKTTTEKLQRDLLAKTNQLNNNFDI
jgi:Malectin domain